MYLLKFHCKNLEMYKFHCFEDHYTQSNMYRKIVRKNSEQPKMAIPNLFKSFQCKKTKNCQNSYFWPFQIYTSYFGTNFQKKFGMAIFGHSKFIPVFLGKIQKGHFGCSKFIQVFLGKIGKKFRTAIFGRSKFIPVFLGKIVRKNSERLFLAIPNSYQSFWGKFGMAIFGCSKFTPVFLGQIVRKNLEWPFLAILNLY